MTMTQDVSVRGLNRQHFIQLTSFIQQAKESGEYYGRKDHFDKRTKDLEEWVEMILTSTAGTKFEQKPKENML